MQIIKESIIKKHSYENGEHNSYTEVIEQYHYDSEEERNEHAKRMIENGFKDSGQIKENIGTVMNPKLVWFGSYYKYERNNRRLEESIMEIKSANSSDLFKRLDEIDGELQDFHVSAYKCDLLYKEQDSLKAELR